MASQIQRISIRQLHERTGHYVREAARHQVIITDRGKPIAKIKPLEAEMPLPPYFARRQLNAAFQQHASNGTYTLRSDS